MARLFRRHGKAAPAEADDPTIVSIAEAPARRSVRVRGEVRRMRTRPINGRPSLSVSIGDDTATATIVFTGRRELGGITLGRRLVVEGVGVRVGDHLEFTNPRYTLLP